MVGKIVSGKTNDKVSRFSRFDTSMSPISAGRAFVKVLHVGKLLLETLLLYELLLESFRNMLCESLELRVI